jgi:hypothetical protein
VIQVALLASASVKQLRKEAELIGILFGKAHVGDLSWADVRDVVADAGFRERLQTAFAVAAKDVGEKKALKEALKTSRNYAEAAPHVRNLPYGSVGADAQRAISEMLGRT